MSKIASKEKPIGDVLRVMLLTALNFIESALLKRIESDRVDTGLSLVAERLRQVVVALNDANPDNKSQVLQIVYQFFNVDFSDFAKEVVTEEIARIDDENVRKIAQYALDRSIDLVKLLTDEDLDNKAQLNAFIEFWGRSPETHDILLYSILEPLLQKTNLGEDWIEGILEIIAIALRGQTEIPAETLAKLQV